MQPRFQGFNVKMGEREKSRPSSSHESPGNDVDFNGEAKRIVFSIRNLTAALRCLLVT